MDFQLGSSLGELFGSSVACVWNKGRKLAIVALLCTAASTATAQSLTWDSSGASPAAATDGSGLWTTTNANWTDGALETAWINGDVAIIGNNNGAAGTITIGQSGITAAGVTFNPPGSGDYTIAASGTNTLALSGAAAVNVATGLSPTISAPIAGTAGLNLVGPGTLNLTGNNTFSGKVAINSGTLVVAAGGSLGAISNALVLGTSNTGTSVNDPVGAATLNNSVTVSSFRSSANNSTGTNTLTIGGGSTLNVNANSALADLNATVNAAFVFGSPNSAAPIVSKLTIGGGGTLSVGGGTNNSSFLIGMGNSNSSANTMNATLDMSGLANFSFTTGTGAVPAAGGNEFAVGHGGGAVATASLAANSSITAGTITVGDQSLTPGLTGTIPAPNAPTNTSVLNLGSGTNTLNANNFVIGNVRSQGTIQWLSTVSTGSVTIAGATGGASTADFTIGQFSLGTPPSSASTLDLHGHNATVQAGTVTLGSFLTGGGNGTAGSGKGGSIVFDTGLFTVANLRLATASGTGGLANSFINGTFQLGSSSNSTGVLNVTNSFLIGNVTGTNVGAKGTFTIRGGTANISTNIIDVSTVNTSSTTLALSGGTLNMNGFAIGPIGGGTGGTRHVTTITFPTLGNSAVLQSLGGTGINDAGLTMNGTGTLVLEGNSTYSGGTTIATGTLQIGQASDVVAPSGALQATVTDNATLAFGSSQPLTVASTISGSGGVSQVGAGTTTVTGANSYAGPTSLVAGVLSVGSLPAGGTNSPLGASSNAASNLVFTGGTLQYTGPAVSSDRLFTVTPTGGSLDASGTGPVAFNNGGSVISSDPAPRTTTDSITSARVTLANVADLVPGMTVTGTNIPAGTTIVSINPSANSITLSNIPTAAGTDTLSFSTTGRTFTLTGSNTGANTFGDVLSNSAGGGALSLAKSGTGNWVLSAANTYTGSTRVNSGTLTLGVANAIAGATHSNVILNGGALATGGFNQTLGTLQILAKSGIDVGGVPNALSFDNSNSTINPALVWTANKLLTITNWIGNVTDPTLGGGSDRVLIGTDNTGLSASQLSQIKFDNYKSGATILGTGEIVPASSIIILPGDFNFSGHTDPSDVQPMLDALTDLATFQTSHSLSNFDMLSIGDINQDGALNNKDIQPLLDLVSGSPGAGSLQAVPEPATLLLAALALPLPVTLLRRRSVPV